MPVLPSTQAGAVNSRRRPASPAGAARHRISAPASAWISLRSLPLRDAGFCRTLAIAACCVSSIHLRLARRDRLDTQAARPRRRHANRRRSVGRSPISPTLLFESSRFRLISQHVRHIRTCAAHRPPPETDAMSSPSRQRPVFLASSVTPPGTSRSTTGTASPRPRRKSKFLRRFRTINR